MWGPALRLHSFMSREGCLQGSMMETHPPSITKYPPPICLVLDRAQHLPHYTDFSPLPPRLPHAPPIQEGCKNPLLLYLLPNPNARRRSTAGLNLCSSGDQPFPPPAFSNKN